MKLKIDGQTLEFDQPMSLCKAASSLGIEIPTLCNDGELEHFTSCMMCVVRDKASGRLLPACSARAQDGMEIETQDDQIRAFRKSTLELLLSDHVGDCEAPCQTLCPVQLDVPRMIRAIRTGNLEEAIRLVRKSVAIPSILERFCNVPCERGCRRGKHDQPLSIRNMTRYAADWDLKRDQQHLPACAPDSSKRVLIAGAGASGLAAAHYLSLLGHRCTVQESLPTAGGRIETEFGRPIEEWVLNGEIAVLKKMGVEFEFNRPLDRESLAEARSRFDGVLLAIGRSEIAGLAALGLETTSKGLKMDPGTFQTSTAGVFACGSLLKPGQPLIKSVASARDAAACLDQFLRGVAIEGIPDHYNHTMGRLLDGEMEEFLKGADPRPRQGDSQTDLDGFTAAGVADETLRCLHCDCRANLDCKLREYSDAYGAKQSQFSGEGRGRHEQINQGHGALYEPGKCVKCGLCVRLTEKEQEKFGFAFVGRGYDVKPGVALGKPLQDGFGSIAAKVIETCPTGALVSE